MDDTKTRPRNDLRTARESFSGRLLTDNQFEDAIAITDVIRREILKTGTFKDKLGDYAYAFARSEKFDAVKADTIVRDLFKERLGVSMNQLREELLDREKAITDADRKLALRNVGRIEGVMENGNKISFGRAYAFQAEDLAATVRITQVAAKILMKEVFQAVHKDDFSDWGKALDERIYRPQIEAAAHEREAQARTRPYGRTRTGQSRS